MRTGTVYFNLHRIHDFLECIVFIICAALIAIYIILLCSHGEDYLDSFTSSMYHFFKKASLVFIGKSECLFVVGTCIKIEDPS